ncbi:MAG: septum formation initiator family protein [Pseudomonadota bacterium]
MVNQQTPAAKVRSKLGSGLALLCLLAIGAYAVLGPTGVLAWGDYQQRLQERKAELAALTEKEAALENRINLLEPGNADPDLAGELIRKELNVVHPDEIVVPLN